ncbi:hypothetical protein BH11PSE3_BH11PSE3_32680 [soil metagenome]
MSFARATDRPVIAAVPNDIGAQELAAQIEWHVSELALLHSHLGRTIHHPVARLPLNRRGGH